MDTENIAAQVKYLKLCLELWRHMADQIEVRAAARRAKRPPAIPHSALEKVYRQRDYDARARAKRLRLESAYFVKEIQRLEELADPRLLKERMARELAAETMAHELDMERRAPADPLEELAQRTWARCGLDPVLSSLI